MFQVDAGNRFLHVFRKPAWWLLYAIGVLLVGAIAMLERAVATGPVRTALESVMVIAAFALMLFWRHLNRARWV